MTGPAMLIAEGCGRRIHPGEDAVLRFDTRYCVDCAAALPATDAIIETYVAVRHGARCGGGAPLD